MIKTKMTKMTKPEKKTKIPNKIYGLYYLYDLLDVYEAKSKHDAQTVFLPFIEIREIDKNINDDFLVKLFKDNKDKTKKQNKNGKK